jgi:predicted nuclease with TOPRIM domain
MSALLARLNRLQATYTEMKETVEYLEQDITLAYEYEVLLKKRLESLKDEIEMNEEELILRKAVLRNIPIQIAEIKKLNPIKYLDNSFREDDEFLYDTWNERIM